MGAHGLGRFFRKNHGWAGLKFDSPWADFYRPSPVHRSSGVKHYIFEEINYRNKEKTNKGPASPLPPPSKN